MAFDAGALVAKLKLDTRGFQAGVQQATKQTKGMEKQALSLSKVLGKTLAIGALGALSIGFKKTVDAAGEFEKSMANVATLVDTAVVDIGKLSDEVLDMTTVVTKSADDLSAGLYQVFSAGVTDAAEAMEVLKVSAIAATAGLADTRSSVDAITTIINAYGLAASKATDISDLMFQTVKLGKTTFTELASSIGTVIAPAASLGIKLEDLFSAMATLTKGGFDTRVATTALRATFLSILKPTDDAIETARELGLEWSAAALKAKGLVKFLNDIKEAAGGSTEIMAKLIPETRALNAVLALTGAQSEELNKILGQMKDRLGATQGAFKTQEDTYDTQAQKLGLLVDRMQIKIGNIFLPTLTNMLKGVLGLFDTVGEEFVKLATGASKTKTEAQEAANKTQAIMKKMEDFLIGLGVTTERELNKQIIAWRKMGFEVPKFLTNYQTSIAETALANIKLRESFEEQAKAIAKTLEDASQKGIKAAEAITKSWKGTSDEVKEAFESLGVVSKLQFDQLVKDQVKAFETIVSEQELSDEEVLRLRETLFENLKALADQAKEEGVLGVDIEEFKTRLGEVHQEVLNKSTDTAKSVQELGNTTTITLKGFLQDSTRLASDAIEGVESLIEQITGTQETAFSSMIDEIDRYKSAYITAEEAITEVVAVETDERLAILQRFVQTASGLRREAGAFGLPISGITPVTPVGEAPATTQNNITQSVNINNAGNGSVEQGQDTIRAFNQMNASLSF